MNWIWGSLLARYTGGGTSSDHPRMMLKVIVYAYAQKIYSLRKIEKALWENIGFMWISGGNRPDVHTINNFRGETMKEAVRKVFAAMMVLLVEAGYVKMENYLWMGQRWVLIPIRIKWRWNGGWFAWLTIYENWRSLDRQFSCPLLFPASFTQLLLPFLDSPIFC